MHSKMVTKFRALVGALLAVAAATSASAGIKYWNNPAFKVFDVGDYVQDGLILNYDGIRNVGADAEHDSTATTWKNLGSSGSTYDATLVKNDNISKWTENSYYFGGATKFVAKMDYRRTYTMQLLSDAKRTDQTGGKTVYYVCGDADAQFALASYDQYMYLRTQGNGNDTGFRMFIDSTKPIGYVNSILDSEAKYATLFAGIEKPNSSEEGAYRTYDSMKTPSFSDFCIGGWKWGENQNQKGAIRFFRYYSRVLTNEELAWNRIVDEARYFGVKSSSLPVTNVVVASNIPIVCGDEPNGCYALDGEGYTFAAPASKVVKGRTYTLDGYTIEVWNGNAWGGVTTYNGKTSYTAKTSELIRLTWRWTPGNGLVAYDVEDYVQDGLILNYDGIRNAGADVAHDSAATTWSNLGLGGSAYDMKRYSKVNNAWVENASCGAWTDKGFVFDKNSVFTESSELLISNNRTMQVLVDAKASDQNGIGDVVGCYNGTHWDLFSICMRSNGTIANSFYIPVFGSSKVKIEERPAIFNDNATYDYGTAIVEGNDCVWFAGTTAPWDAEATGGKTGHLKKDSLTLDAFTDTGISLGGRYPDKNQSFKGTIKFFRYYNRVLSNDDVAWNRIVDDARFFAEPMVFVASTRADVQANERDGSYGVVGSYTFTAPAQVTAKNGITYAPAGYAIQVWDSANGVWGGCERTFRCVVCVYYRCRQGAPSLALEGCPRSAFCRKLRCYRLCGRWTRVSSRRYSQCRCVSRTRFGCQGVGEPWCCRYCT